VKLNFRLLVLSLLLFQSKSFAQNEPAAKEWTVLVYMNSDNNLYQDGLKDIAEMESVGSSSSVNIVLQMDPEPRGLPTSRYFITRQQRPLAGQIHSQVLERLGETNMGDLKILADFLVWGVQKFPAKKYLVVIWNHGNGWQGVSQDDNPISIITIPQVRQALAVVNQAISNQNSSRNTHQAKIDIINFDACLMSTLEVAYELRDSGQFLVGSQFLEPGTGEDYFAMLRPLVQKPQMTPRELSEVMVYQYSLQYKSDSEINYAAIDLNRVEVFTRIFNSAIQSALKSNLRNQIQRAIVAPTDPRFQSFDLLTGLINGFEAGQSDAIVREQFDSVIQAYGYPQEVHDFSSRGYLSGARKVVTRSTPGVVFFRNSNNSPWTQIPLAEQSNGKFSAQIPQDQNLQYYVIRKSNFRRSLSGQGAIQYREALSSFMTKRSGQQIVFHNNFPESSPLVADSYTLSSKNARGMTLYSLAGIVAKKSPNLKARQLGNEILKSYKQLEFSSHGAPAWSQLFGF